MTNQELIQAVIDRKRIDTKEDYDLAQRVKAIQKTGGQSALDVAAGLLGQLREYQRREATLMANA